MSVHRTEGGGGKAKSGVHAGNTSTNVPGLPAEYEPSSPHDAGPGSPLSDPSSPPMTYVTHLLEAVTCELHPDSPEENNIIHESRQTSPRDSDN